MISMLTPPHSWPDPTRCRLSISSGGVGITTGRGESWVMGGKVNVSESVRWWTLITPCAGGDLEIEGTGGGEGRDVVYCPLPRTTAHQHRLSEGGRRRERDNHSLHGSENTVTQTLNILIVFYINAVCFHGNCTRGGKRAGRGQRLVE